MSTGKRPKSAPGKKAAVHASHLAVGNGQQERGYKAGALHGVNGHRTHAHQPCLRDYTDGALTCPYCESEVPLVWRGYVPVWDRDFALRYCLIGKDVEESVDCIQRGEQITVNRAKSMRSPLIVRAETCLTRSLPDKAPWNCEVSMEDICLLLWQIPALSLWVRSTRGTSDNALSLTPTGKKEPKQSNGKPFSPEYRNAAMKAEARGLAAVDDAAADAEREILRRLQKPSTNGKHAKKEGS